MYECVHVYTNLVDFMMISEAADFIIINIYVQCTLSTEAPVCHSTEPTDRDVIYLSDVIYRHKGVQTTRGRHMSERETTMYVEVYFRAGWFPLV